MSQDMTPDDPWVRRLRSRADEVTPDIPADAGTARRLGRRRRAVRRASAVGGAAAVAIAVSLGAAPSMRLVTDEVQPALLLPDPTVKTIVPTREQLAERELALARKAQQNGLVDPPDVAVVRWITRDEHPSVMADCLIAAGWPITNVSASGYDVEYTADQEAAMILSDYVCDAQYPVAAP